MVWISLNGTRRHDMAHTKERCVDESKSRSSSGVCKGSAGIGIGGAGPGALPRACDVPGRDVGRLRLCSVFGVFNTE